MGRRFFVSLHLLDGMDFLWYYMAIGGGDMPEIIPIKDLKDTARVSELCHSVDEPIFITKNGYGDMVLMSMDYYELNCRKWEKYQILEESRAQIERGEGKGARESISKIKKKIAKPE